MATKKHLQRDHHHLLYTEHLWTESPKSWARHLRKHSYLIVKIPRKTLHTIIHQELPLIPPPSEEICASTFFELERLCKKGILNRRTDQIEDRLQFLITYWGQYADASDSVKSLLAQKRLISSFLES